MSHLAADLAGYGFDNLWFLGEFLDDPTLFSVPRGIDSPRMAASSDYREDITLRSAGYFLLRYLFDRLGGLAIDPDGTIRDTGGLDLLRTQFTGDLRGVAVLEAAVGLERRAFVPDWLTAMLLDGRTAPDGAPLATPRRFRFADPVTDPLTGVQNGIALNADNAYLDWGSVFLANVAPADLIDWDHVLYGGGIALLLVRPVAPGPVVARVSAEEGAEVGVRWVRIR
jgi:hypothetical protein